MFTSTAWRPDAAHYIRTAETALGAVLGSGLQNLMCCIIPIVARVSHVGRSSDCKTVTVRWALLSLLSHVTLSKEPVEGTSTEEEC